MASSGKCYSVTSNGSADQPRTEWSPSPDMIAPDHPRLPSRDVIQAEALAWLHEHPADSNTSVITSLPDISELSEFELPAYKQWFLDASRRIIRWVSSDGVAIFYQSDIRHEGIWIDKGYLVMRAAEDEKAYIVWHKIVCRRPPLTVSVGRPSYSHMICVSPTPMPRPLKPGPDVLPDAGHMSWSRAMGVTACTVACRFVRENTNTTTIVDPFCGRGTVLAVANELGFDAIGVDLGGKRCRIARNAHTAVR